MKEKMKIEIELTKQDLVDFNFALAKRNGAFWINIFCGVFFLMNLMVQLYLGRPFSSYAFSLFFVLFCAISPIRLYRSALRSYQNKYLKEKKNYEFTSDGFRMEGESATLKAGWQDVQRVDITKKGIYLFTAPREAHLFPQRLLGEDDQIKAMILQHTTAESRSKGKPKLLHTIAIFLFIFIVSFGLAQFFLARNGG